MTNSQQPDHNIWDNNPHSEAFRKMLYFKHVQRAPVLSVRYDRDAWTYEARLKCRHMNEAVTKMPGIEILSVAVPVAQGNKFKEQFEDWCRNLLHNMNIDRLHELQAITRAELDPDLDHPITLTIAEAIQDLAKKVTGC